MKNWYKIAQEQQAFPFHKDPLIKGNPPPTYGDEYSQWLENANPNDPNSIKEIIGESNGKWEILSILRKFNIKWKEFKFANNNNVIAIYFNGKNKFNSDKDVYVIGDPDWPDLENARYWLDKMYDHEVESYMPSEDSNEKFWKQVGNGSFLYHATSSEYVEDIMKHGLRPMDKTRGISNRSTGSAVFTSDNPDDISSYGDYIFSINVGQMKADGYMPNVEQEGPISIALQKKQIADIIGLQNYYPADEYNSEGLYESTYIIFGKIPPKYLKSINF